MSTKRYALLAVAWAVSLWMTTVWLGAQIQRWTPLTDPVVVSGPDLGFRIEWMNGRTPTGQLVVRIDGRWVNARVGQPGDRQVIPSAPIPDPPPR